MLNERKFAMFEQAICSFKYPVRVIERYLGYVL